MAYELIKHPDYGNNAILPVDQMRLLENMNIQPVKFNIIESQLLTNEFLSNVLQDWRLNYDYEIDGIIVCNNGIYERLSGNPKHAFAFKMVLSDQIVESMVLSRTGHIINVGSIAAKEAYPKGNVYCATKAAVDKFTEGLRIDLNEYNIKVGAIHPGLVNTNFSTVRFKGDKKRADLVYNGLTPLLGKDIADIIFFMVECPYHVNISDITVLPTAQANTYILNKQKN